MGKVIQEFKSFILRGNVVDMAVGIIMGAAFGKIVSSLVGDIVMPVIGIFLGGVNFADLHVILKHAVMEGDKVIKPAVSLNYGNFIQVTIDFLTIAISIFLCIKGMNKLVKKKEAAPAPPPAPPADVVLLTEIRDLLKDKESKS